MRKIKPTYTKGYSKKCSDDDVEISMDEVMNMITDSSDYEYREIVIDGEIDASCLSKYTMPIIRINKIDDEEGIPIEERQPIKLYISCVGGDVLSGFALIDIIKASKTPIIAITLDKSYSMGFLIAIGCKTRYCYANSSFLSHDGYLNLVNSGGKAKDMYDFYVIKGEEKLKKYILENTKIPKAMLNRKWNNEWYIDSKEALQLGIVDEILTEII